MYIFIEVTEQIMYNLHVKDDGDGKIKNFINYFWLFSTYTETTRNESLKILYLHNKNETYNLIRNYKSKKPLTLNIIIIPL